VCHIKQAKMDIHGQQACSSMQKDVNIIADIQHAFEHLVY